MSNRASNDKPTEYLPGGAMANAYVPRGRQENRRITRRAAQPYPNSAEQRKIPVPNPPAGAPSGNADVSALAGQNVTEIIPPINPSTNIHSDQSSATPSNAAANQSFSSPNAPYLDNKGALASSSDDLAGATPQVESLSSRYSCPPIILRLTRNSYGKTKNTRKNAPINVGW